MPRARLTVTFHRPKPGHFLAEGPDACGRLHLADIGLGARGDDAALGLEPSWPGAPDAAPAALAKTGGHKYDHGHALVLAGGFGRGGAARMTAHGALRVGAGAVTLACPPAALIENAAHLDAIMLRPVPDAGALGALLDDARIGALALGPGLGTAPREAGLVAAALASRRAAVLDADALTLVAGDTDLRGALHDRCVLTPHLGEFRRLFPDLAEELAAPAGDKVAVVRRAAAACGATVLLKGPDTVVADPGGAAVLCWSSYGRAAPWLATAGAGDVLAGLVAGLLARGLAPRNSASLAARLHVDCALAFGPGASAGDLPDRLPAVLKRLQRPHPAAATGASGGGI